MSLLHPIDRFLNGMTMYKVVLYALFALAAVSMAFAGFGLLTYGIGSLVVSLAVLVFVSYGANELIARLFGVAANPESSVITGLILFFVLAPADSLHAALLLASAAVVAMASKYVLTIGRQHVLNPAAIAAVLVGIPTGIAYWWVGTPVLLVPTLILALLVVRKTRRFHLFLAMLVPGTVAGTLLGLYHGQAAPEALWQFFSSWPVLFFAAFMVTEPFTAPGTRKARILYGAAVGIVSSLPLHVGIVYSTPELTLAIANAVAFGFGLRRKLILRLTRREELAKDTYGFHFAVEPRPSFKAGQYLEWTLPHASPDLRGIRRYFTIASSPSEDELAIGVKFAHEGSSFKKRLLELVPGDTMHAAALGGDFTLPRDPAEKLAFIAGGIGVTPFRSMIRKVLDAEERRDIALFYACKTEAEVAYHDLWAEASEKIGLRTLCVLADEEPSGPHAVKGFVTEELLAQRLPDWKERTFYLSGPDAMVQAYRKLLRRVGVPASRIRTDYFPGF